MPSFLPVLSSKQQRSEQAASNPRSSSETLQAESMSEAVKLMNKAVYAVQMAMYNGLKSSGQLKSVTSLLTQHEYADVVSERSIIKQCGYPLCSNLLKSDRTRKGRYHISLRDHRVYDLEETRQFCSQGCTVSSKKFSTCLQTSREDVVEHNKLEEIIACVRGLNLSDSDEKQSLSPNDLVLYERMDEELGLSDALPALKEDESPVRKGAHQQPKLKSAFKQSPRKHQRISWADEQPDVSPKASPAEEIASEKVEEVARKDEDVGVSELSEVFRVSELNEDVRVPELIEDVRVPELIEDVRVPEDFTSVWFVSPEKLEEVVTDEVPELIQDQDFVSPWFDSPPKAYRKEVSMFGTIWMALDGWVSASTIGHIYKREDSLQEFVHVNDRVEAPPAVDDILPAEIMKTMSTCIARVLPEVVQALELSSPVSFLEQALGRLLRTMSFTQALPGLGTKEWRLICVLFLDALSVHQIPSLREQLSDRSLLEKLVKDSGTSDAEYGAYKQLLLPLGRLGSFPATGGG